MRSLARQLFACAVLAGLCTCLACSPGATDPHAWSDRERRRIDALWLGHAGPVPPDPSNRAADDPRAVELGHALYFDGRLSGPGNVSCATCHDPQLAFTDGRALSRAVGRTKRHAPSVVGTAYGEWFYWDGRRDSQWAQALTPLEDPAEHAATRAQLAHVIAEHHREPFEALFGPMPDLSGVPSTASPIGDDGAVAAWESMTRVQREAVNHVFAGIGKAIAAYERTLVHGPAPFDRYAEALRAHDEQAMRAAMPDDAARGLRLFIGRANCTDCHNGPRFTNDGFHNIGLPLEPDEPFDKGRSQGAYAALDHEFNCLSPYSDAEPGDCDALRFVKLEGLELMGAMKVPSLRNVADTAPYMHRGHFETLGDVLEHYDEAPLPVLGHSDLEPLELTDGEKADLIAFLQALSGGVDADPALLAPPGTGTGKERRH